MVIGGETRDDAVNVDVDNLELEPHLRGDGTGEVDVRANRLSAAVHVLLRRVGKVCRDRQLSRVDEPRWRGDRALHRRRRA